MNNAYYRIICHLLLVFASNLGAQAQILNVESLRQVSDSSKLSGYVQLDFDLEKNKNKKIELTNTIHVQYAIPKHLILGISEIKFNKLNSEDFSNKQTQHLRYNYKINKHWQWEVFGQYQRDAISYIQNRSLAGTGPRIKLTTNDNYRLYLGLLSMYEFEHIKSALQNSFERTVRNSSYFSFSLYPNQQVSIVSTSYYQPQYANFKDYRLSSDNAISVTLHKNLSMTSDFTYTYDTRPARSIPRQQYELTLGLTYSFD